MIAALDKLSKDNIKSELCIVVRSMMIMTSSDLRHRLYFYENNAYIQRLTHLGPHTIELAHNQDLTIPGAYN